MLTTRQLDELDKLMGIYNGLHYGSTLQGTIRECRMTASNLRYFINVRTKIVFDRNDKASIKMLSFRDRVQCLKEVAQLNRLATLLEMQYGHLF